MADPVTLGLIAMGGSTLLGAGSQYQAGRAQQAQYELSAKSEEVGAIQREADRKDALVRAMASQTASAGARGISAYEGSPLTILQEDIRKEEVATERDLLNTKIKKMSLQQAGKSAKSQGTLGAVTSLLTGGAQMATLMPGKTASTKPAGAYSSSTPLTLAR